MGHHEKDTWSNRERTQEKNGKMTCDENKLTSVICSYHHVDCYKLATSLSPLRHVLPAALPASVDEATWSASVPYGACQRRHVHVDQGVQ